MIVRLCTKHGEVLRCAALFRADKVCFGASLDDLFFLDIVDCLAFLIVVCGVPSFVFKPFLGLSSMN